MTTHGTTRRPRRAINLILGSFFTVVGFIGIITPVLPTTIFLILASGFFVKSSPRMYRWLNENRLTGPYLRAYTRGEGLSPRRKIGTIVFLWVALVISGIAVRSHLWIVGVLAVVGISVTIHVATIRPRHAGTGGPDRGEIP